MKIQKIIKAEGGEFKRHIISLLKDDMKLLNVKEGDTVWIVTNDELVTTLKP